MINLSKYLQTNLSKQLLHVKQKQIRMIMQGVYICPDYYQTLKKCCGGLVVMMSFLNTCLEPSTYSAWQSSWRSKILFFRHILWTDVILYFSIRCGDWMCRLWNSRITSGYKTQTFSFQNVKSIHRRTKSLSLVLRQNSSKGLFTSS